MVPYTKRPDLLCPTCKQSLSIRLADDIPRDCKRVELLCLNCRIHMAMNIELHRCDSYTLDCAISNIYHDFCKNADVTHTKTKTKDELVDESIMRLREHMKNGESRRPSVKKRLPSRAGMELRQRGIIKR